MTPTTVTKPDGSFLPALITEGGETVTINCADSFLYENLALRLATKYADNNWSINSPKVNRQPYQFPSSPPVNYITPAPQPAPDYGCMAPTTERANPTRTTPQHTSEQVRNDIKYELPTVMDMSTSGGSMPILEVPLEIPDQSPIPNWDEQLQKVRLFNARELHRKFYEIKERLTEVTVSAYELGEIAAEHGKGLKANPYVKKYNPVEHQQWVMGFEDWTC